MNKTRLIDADKIINILKDRATNEAVCGYMTAYDVTKSIIGEIDEQPVAYDVDKAIKQLEDMESLYQRLRELKDKDYLKYGYKIETLIDVIKIVKAGVKV